MSRFSGVLSRAPLSWPPFDRLLTRLWFIDLSFICGYVLFRIGARLAHIEAIPQWLEVSSDEGIAEHPNVLKWT